MALARRKLKSGIRYRYDFKVNGQRYVSKWQFKTAVEAQEGECNHRNALKGDTLRSLFDKRLDDLRRSKRSQDYLKESARVFNKALAEWGEYTRLNTITKPLAYDLVRKEADRLETAGKTTHKVNAMTSKSEYSSVSGKKIRRCLHCNAKNREEDLTCINCGRPLL